MKRLLLSLILVLIGLAPAWADRIYDHGDTNGDGLVTPEDISTLIDYLLNGVWPADAPFVYNVNGVTFKMVYVEGGTFTMGATEEQGTESASNERPAHEVTLSTYCIGQTEVTQELWEAVMGESQADICSRLNISACGVGNDYPVYLVSWETCQAFVARLNELTGLAFRLPTEAEWEFAARGGIKSMHYKYSGSNQVDDVAWYVDNRPKYGTQPVATRAANELGLYDMSGNVQEWCQDWFGSYTSDAQTDPQGRESGSYRVFRGGCWARDASYCRVSHRSSNFPTYHLSDVGLRLAL